MDLSIAKSIYEHAKVVKNNKIASDAERVIEEYSRFRRDNPSLPYIDPFCKLDHTGPLIKLLNRHGEDKIDAIIKALEPFIPKFIEDMDLSRVKTIKPKDWAEAHGVKVDVVMKLLRDAGVNVRTHMSKIDYREYEIIEAMAEEEKRKQIARNQNMIARSIYERANVVKNNKTAAEAKKIIEDYSAFQKKHPSLPTIVPFCELDCYSPLIQLLNRHGEEKIDTIIKALEPFIPKFNDSEFLIGKATVLSGYSKEPFTIKIHKDQEAVRCLEKQNSERKRTQELSQFLDSILKEAKFMETEWLEFKTIFLRDRYDYLGRIFSGLSNTARLYNLQYAYLIYGINESKGEISGTNFNTESNVWQIVEQDLRQRFNPSIKFEILEFNYNGDPRKHIVIFKIHAAADKPVAYRGESFLRHGDKNVHLKDYPNLLEIISNSTSQQPVDNSIVVISQNPQIIFNINLGNVNIAPQNQTTVKNSPKKSYAKLIIELIIAILSFSGVSSIFIISCDNSDKKTIEISPVVKEQNNSHNQSPIVNGDNATINYYVNNDHEENNYNTKDSIITSSQSVNEEISSSSSKTIEEVIDKKKRDIEQTACLLYRDAMRINPDATHVIGNLKSLVFNYNKFAKKNKLDTVEHKGKFHEQSYGLGSIGDSSSHMLPFVKFNVEKFIKINNINCD